MREGESKEEGEKKGYRQAESREEATLRTKMEEWRGTNGG